MDAYVWEAINEFCNTLKTRLKENIKRLDFLVPLPEGMLPMIPILIF